MTISGDNPHPDHQSVPPAPPRISRDAAPEPLTERLGAQPEQTQWLPQLPVSKFTAGTTYGGPGGSAGPVPSPPTVPPQQQVMPVSVPHVDTSPTEHIPAPPPRSTPGTQQAMPVTPLPSAPPLQQAMPVNPPPTPSPSQKTMPVIGPQNAGPKGYLPPPASAAPPQQAMPVTGPQNAWNTQQYQPPPAASQPFELQPSHALWGLTGLAALATLFAGVGWILVVGGCAFGAWHFGQRHVRWPTDVQELLARVGLAQLASTRSAGVPAPIAYIPFRPMTFPELFTGAFKVLGRNWPTLVGIPMAILLAAGVAGAIVGFVVIQIMISSGDAVFGSAGFGLLLAVFGILFLLVYAIALPLDAILIALTVITTDKAVRGERIRLTDMFTLARQRILAVTRLTLVFYGIFIVTDIVVYTIVTAAVMTSSLAAGIFFYIVLLAANFLLGIIFSLAPIVVIIEPRGALDSLKRSMHLVKSAFGRILAIHLLWAVCVTPILLIPSLTISFILGGLGMLLFIFIALPFLLAYVRAMQVLVYTDLRIRQENYEQELIADWARNTRIP